MANRYRFTLLLNTSLLVSAGHFPAKTGLLENFVLAVSNVSVFAVQCMCPSLQSQLKAAQTLILKSRSTQCGCCPAIAPPCHNRILEGRGNKLHYCKQDVLHLLREDTGALYHHTQIVLNTLIKVN